MSCAASLPYPISKSSILTGVSAVKALQSLGRLQEFRAHQTRIAGSALTAYKLKYLDLNYDRTFDDLFLSSPIWKISISASYARAILRRSHPWGREPPFRPALPPNGLSLRPAAQRHVKRQQIGRKYSIGDVYLTIADEVLKTPLEKRFPTAEEKVSEIV
jgi:hypothetical protein